MTGVFTTTSAFSRFFILWLGVTPNFSRAQQSADRNSQKNNEKLGATPNQRIKKRESGFVVEKKPFILTLTPKPHPTPTPTKPNFN